MAKNQKNQGFAAIRDVVSSSRFRESRIKETETETESIKETELETESIKESETETISQIESETTSQYTFDENETNASSINTGDRNHGKLWLVIAIIALAGCIAAAVMYVVSKRK